MTRINPLANLNDVAQAAGVSPSTVSRYLNAGLSLPPATSKRIDAAIGKLGYVPNPHARSLGRGRSDTVGLVIPDVANPFFASLASAVEQAAEKRGQAVLLSATSNGALREIEYVSRMLRNRVSGLLFVSGHHHGSELAATLNDASGVVLIDEDVPGVKCPKVFCDNHNGGLLAGLHLTGFGHRRLAFAGGPADLASTRERFAGLKEAAAMSGARIVFEECGPYSADQGRLVAARLLQAASAPTAVFVSSGEIAFGLLEALHCAGVAVPEYLSLVVFDDAGPLHLFNPALTAIRQPIKAMGEKAVELALAKPNDDAAGIEFRLPVELIVRASVAMPRKK